MFVTPRCVSRSSMAGHHRPLIVGYPHPSSAQDQGLRILCEEAATRSDGFLGKRRVVTRCAWSPDRAWMATPCCGASLRARLATLGLHRLALLRKDQLLAQDNHVVGVQLGPPTWTPTACVSSGRPVFGFA
jgi:hypothetical protein